MKWSFGAAAGFVLALGFATPALAAADAFLQIDGVKGESRDAQYPGSIEITSWSYSGGGTPGGAGSGRSTGHVNLGDIHITKANDSASPVLMQASATGRHYKSATLSLRKAGESQPYLQYKMSDVMISSYSASGHGGGATPSESVTLNFAKLEIVDHAQTHEGAATRGMIPSASHLPPPGAAN
jgi:type VI secretion system Hcp family effector